MISYLISFLKCYVDTFKNISKKNRKKKGVSKVLY